MKKLHFETVINASRDKVWYNIVNEKPYMEWTAMFMPGSSFEGSWDKGAKIRFIARNEEGKIEGMTSEIAENKPYDFISIRHLGVIQNGVEDKESEEVKKWTPSYENYTFIETGDKTRFVVDMDVEDSYAEMFSDMWPKALKKLKEISERN
jgi:uncharacterized protein YndB with AHSA1/START domain